MVTLEHCCQDFAQKKQATRGHLYHFVRSGLPNVFLSGIRYYVCSDCGKQSADIPAIEELMFAIARALVQKSSALTGFEIRFLRKRLGLTAAVFANIIGVSPENFSRWENDHNPPADSADRLIRVSYSLISGDKKLQELVQNRFQEWITSIHGIGHNERIIAERVRNRQWSAETESIAA
jgi:putative zinc finger/helix-turn-helix YgiT family protein